MKTLELAPWGIPLTVTLLKHERDQFDPQSGHYTVPYKWKIETIEHEGSDITEIVSDEIIYIIERDANQ